MEYSIHDLQVREEVQVVDVVMEMVVDVVVNSMGVSTLKNS